MVVFGLRNQGDPVVLEIAVAKQVGAALARARDADQNPSSAAAREESLGGGSMIALQGVFSVR